MREKELRIALVCFGGVSLAIYMHGITKEILKLVRASGALHAIADRGARARASFFDAHDRNDPEYDTEAVYFDLLREIGRHIELRVIVDIIAGASAGGINGTMLARALSHDLPMARLRDLWLDNADVTVLLAREARASVWSKWILKPLIWAAATTGMLNSIKDPEIRRKLSLFVRSRWFKPPLDGHRMAALMYDAVTAMGQPRRPIASLVPSAQRLDLFVTLTDYRGYLSQIRIHDPPLIYEREHHHVLHFSYRRATSGEVESDFELENAPGLAFAARATSSFPGAFPPARIIEMDELVAQKRTTWARRAGFIAGNFAPHLQSGIDPATTSFIDGSVLNNRPFHEAIAAITGRPAYRQVDRRLVYIDPDPAPAGAPAQRAIPGFFATLKGAMSDIPRNQPVTDELSWVANYNDEVRGVRSIIEGARPQVSRLVATVVTGPLDKPIAAEQIRAWREQVNAHVARDAGFAYQGYVRLKLDSVRGFVSTTIATLRGAPPRSALGRTIAEIIDAWAIRTGVVYAESDHSVLRQEAAPAETIPSWAQFFLAFDVHYRQRRLHFLIEGLNRLYQMIDSDHRDSLQPAVVNELKRDLYDRLEALRRRERADFFSPDTRELAEKIFSTAPSFRDARQLRQYAGQFVEHHVGDIDTLVDRMTREIDLRASTQDVDVLLANLASDRWSAKARGDVLVNYLGFPFWDVLTLSMTSARGPGEFNAILVDRISPQDAVTLGGFNGPEGLKGTGFGHFAAFLSRAYRENDYLFGRLHAADRLIDIVCDSAGLDLAPGGIDIAALKKRAFTAILDAEAGALPESAALVAALRQCIARMGSP